jgi:hypothetical protein
MSKGLVVSAQTGQAKIVDAEPRPESTPEETHAQELAEAKSNRSAAYTAEADPLFFKYQRGEATEQEWLGKIEEIRARYPYPEE